jgi:hypothetical protein
MLSILIETGQLYHSEKKVWWHAATLFVYFFLFLTLHDFYMANLLGSVGLQVTVSSSIDPFPPWDSNLQPTHQKL